jgi:hypothetical protein
MRSILTLVLLLVATVIYAERIILVPLDSRPAAGQYAQLIGKIDGVEVKMPTYEALGRFTTQGNPDKILDWLEDQDLSHTSALIVSTDMICYGGLIASRVYDVPTVIANRRLQRLVDLKKKHPSVKLYLFSSTMRLTPTATRKASKIRLKIAKYEERKDMAERSIDADAKAQMEAIAREIPKEDIDQYEMTRARNHAIQRHLVQMTQDSSIDFLVIGQDDARKYGPHVKETAELKQLVHSLDLNAKVYFCEGVDQHSSVLLSRALLKQANWSPRVRVLYSDDNGKNQFANFESIKIEDSLSEQLLASGARPVGPDGAYDYTLYLNTPKRRHEPFLEFVDRLRADLDRGHPVAVADINLAPDGTADPELFDALWQNGRLMNLLSYAGWNTAGNTIGTSIPAANVYLLARRSQVDPLTREVAQREFLIHRFVNDYTYHKFIRPSAYALIEPDHHEEIYGDEWDEVNTYVSRDLLKQLQTFFDQGFLNKIIKVGDSQYRLVGIDGGKVWLPWPRPYEVRLEFHVEVAPEL